MTYNFILLKLALNTMPEPELIQCHVLHVVMSLYAVHVCHVLLKLTYRSIVDHDKMHMRSAEPAVQTPVGWLAGHPRPAAVRDIVQP